MNPQDRKLQQRIARRKEKVQRLIREQEASMVALDSAIFLRQEDYQKAMSIVRKKLYRLEQELSSLDAGRLPGGMGIVPTGNKEMRKYLENNYFFAGVLKITEKMIKNKKLAGGELF